MGLSLKNTALKIVHKPTGKVVYEDFGEMLFTHFGLSGPMILSASAHLRKVKISECCALLDLKSALDEKTLDTRLRCDFEKNINKDFINSLDGLLPQKLIAPFARRTGIDSREKVNSITKEQRRTIIKNLKAFSIDLKGFRPLEEAIVTAGGVDTREINPKTMESKLVKGLFFAGEVLDLDCYTGGYNLQTAFCTGYVAGKNAAL